MGNVKEKVGIVERLAYALTNIGNIPVQAILGSYLLIFYTNVVGLNPAACATLFLIARVLDGLNDPVVGFLIDHGPTTKMGHFRPTLIIGSIACGINFLLMFYGPYLATGGKLVIAYVTYILIGILFPVMDISLNSMLPVMTADVRERNALSSIKGFAYMTGIFGLNIAAPLIIGDTTVAAGYLRLVTIATIIIIGCSVVGTLGIKERITAAPGTESYKFSDLFRILTQRPVWVTFLSTMAYMVGTYILNTSNTYFFTYVLGDLSLLSIVSLIQLFTLIPFTILAVPLVNRFGKKRLYAVALALITLTPLVRLLNVTNVPILLITTAATGIGSGICMPLTYAIQADNTDYVELNLGVKAQGAVAALSSFVTKCAMGIGGAIPGYVLASVGFDSTAATQAGSVNSAIIFCVIGAPAILGAVGVLVFAILYPLSKERIEEQNAAIAQKRA